VRYTISRITERAHGGDPIKRTTRIDAENLSIGRGSDCNIHLTDLTIGLRHATIRGTGENSVVVEAQPGFTFEVDGRVVERTQLTAGESRQLVFGTYVLSIAQGNSDEGIIVTISQDAGPQDILDLSNAKKAFSVSPLLFSLRNAAWVLGAFIVVVCLAGPVAYYFWQPAQSKIDPVGQWSVGPLSRGHAFLQHNCKACHLNAFRVIPDAGCLSCHQNGEDSKQSARIATQVFSIGSPFAPRPAKNHAASALLAKAMYGGGGFEYLIAYALNRAFEHPRGRCIDCHTEHIGSAGQRSASRRAARPSNVQIQATSCTSCHAQLKARLFDTALLDVPSWDKHPDFRPFITSLFAAGRPRLQNNGAAKGPFDTGIKFSHKQHLAPNGVIVREAQKYSIPTISDGLGTRLSCVACHKPASDGRAFLPIDMKADCAHCHSLKVPAIGGGAMALPHGDPDKVVTQMLAYYQATQGASTGTLRTRPGISGGPSSIPAVVSGNPSIAQKIRGIFTTDGRNKGLCYGCHDFVLPIDRNSLAFKIVRVKLVDRYLPRSGFDHSVPAHNHDAAGQPNCIRCHAPAQAENLSTVMIPGITQCKSCHGNNRAAASVAAQSNCAECHGYHSTGEPLTRELYERPWRIAPGI
jgi:hypothetical protein